MEPKEEPIDDFPSIPAEKETANQSASILKEPKEEPLDHFDLEKEIPQHNFMREKICKEEEMDENEMASSDFDVSTFGPPRDHFPIPLFPREPKEEIIEAEDEIVKEENKGNCIVQNPKDYSETVEVDTNGRPSRNMSRPLKYAEHAYYSDKNEEPLIKKSRSNSDGRFLKCQSSDVILSKHDTNFQSTPQCILCEASLLYCVIVERTKFPKTACAYAAHVCTVHNSTLKTNEIFLLCSCGQEFRSFSNSRKHADKCDGREFTIHKIVEKVHTTPQCIMCEVFPTTARGYATHLYKYHKSTLGKNGIFLLCSCGKEIISNNIRSHSKECDGRQFTLQKLELNLPITPQCVVCENGFYLVCSCGKEVRSYSTDPDRTKKCDGRQFSLHKLDEN